MEPKTACKVETEEEFNRHTCWLGQEEPESTTLASSIHHLFTARPVGQKMLWSFGREETGLTNAVIN